MTTDSDRPRIRLTGWRYVAAAGTAGIAYFLAGRFGLSLALVHESTSAVWPPTGVAIAALLVLGPRAWPAFFAGAFAYNYASNGHVGASVAIAAGNTLEAVVGAWTTARFCRGPLAFERAGDTLRFAALAGLVAPAISATVGVSSLVGTGLAEADAFGVIWLTWWLGDAGGALVLAPPLIQWSLWQRRLPPGVHWSEATAALATALAVAGLAFGAARPGEPAAMAGLLLFPLALAWPIARLGARAASTSLLGMDTVAVAATVNGRGPLAVPDPNDALLLLQLFLTFASVTTLLLAAGRRARAEAVPPVVAGTHPWVAVLLPAVALMPLMLATFSSGVVSAGLAGTAHWASPWAVTVAGGTLSLAIAGLVYSVDVTRRRAGELAASMTQELRRSQENLAEAQRIAHVGSWEWDITRDRITWSDELYRLFGVTPIGRPLDYVTYRGLLHPDDRALVEENVQRALRTGEPFEVEHRIRTPEGTVRWLLGRGHVERGPDGRPVRLRGTAQDISDRQRVEQRIRSVLETAPDAMIVVDATGAIRLVNSAAERQFGWPRTELVGQPIEVLLPDAQRAAHVRYRAAFFREPTARSMARGVELYAVRKDGSSFPAEVALGPFETDEGVLVTAAVRDISERRRIEAERFEARQKSGELERLRQLDQFKTQFINSAAHELNTPLTPIKLELHLLERSIPPGGDETQRKAMGIIQRNFERIESLVRDLLDSARVQAGRLGLTPVPLDLASVARETVESYGSAAREASVALESRLGPGPVVADHRRVTQVLHNLLSNAVKFTPPQGRIEVTTGMTADACFVRVHDTGVGLTAEQMARLFQPFVQVHEMPVLSRPGTGLGLYISQSLAHLHGGRLEVESEGLGRGSTFTLWLPRQLTPSGTPPDRA